MARRRAQAHRDLTVPYDSGPEQQPVTNKQIYLHTDQKTKPPAGMIDFIKKHLQYPKEALTYTNLILN